MSKAFGMIEKEISKIETYIKYLNDLVNYYEYQEQFTQGKILRLNGFLQGLEIYGNDHRGVYEIHRAMKRILNAELTGPLLSDKAVTEKIEKELGPVP